MSIGQRGGPAWTFPKNFFCVARAIKDSTVPYDNTARRRFWGAPPSSNPAGGRPRRAPYPATRHRRTAAARQDAPGRARRRAGPSGRSGGSAQLLRSLGAY